jgi:hypothetical protein
MRAACERKVSSKELLLSPMLTPMKKLRTENSFNCPTTAHAWTFLADKDAMTLCRELLGPEEARDFAEYLSEKVIADEAEAAKAAQKPKTGGLAMQDIIDLSRLISSVGFKDN